MKPITALLSLMLSGVAAFGVPITLVTQDQGGIPGTGNQVGTVNPNGTTSGIQLTTNASGGATLQMFDVGVNLLNEIWGIGSDQNLYRINPVNGQAAFMASTSGFNFNGMAYHPETGDLYLSNNDPSTRGIYRATCDFLGTQTCSMTLVSGILPTGSGGDIAFHYLGTQLFLFLAGEDARIHRMTTSGTWTIQASTPGFEVQVNGIGVYTKGLASDGTNLYGAGSLTASPFNHVIYQIDPNTLSYVSGTGSTILNGNSTHVAGLGSNIPGVPEPASIVTTLSAAMLLLVLRRRRADPHGCGVSTIQRSA